jgi:predicted metal-binding protein
MEIHRIGVAESMATPTFYNRYREFKSFIKCGKCTFRRRVRWFKISKLVYGGREIVRSV